MDVSKLDLTPEQLTICNANHKKAREYFGIKVGDYLVLHHKDPDLRHTDIERYIEWRPEDLVVMSNSDHIKLHR